MPWYKPCEEDKDRFKAEYRYPRGLGIIDNRIGGVDVLDEKRKEYATLLQTYKAYQKECGGKKDIEGAKFFKEEVRETQKHYYGLCAVLDYAGHDAGDCKDSLKNMSEEIAPYTDYWFGMADILLEQKQIRVMRNMGLRV